LANWWDGYCHTLKGRELEEWLDLVFYRPLAYVAVRLLARTPLTPDGVTRLSAAFGLAAGICFWQGKPGLDRLGVALFAFGNVLDCADGMLARLRGRGSPFGRIFDGVADYLASTFVFLGIAHGMELRYEAAWPWTLIVAAGVSLAWWCSVVDRMRLEWQHRVLGGRPGRDAELSAFARQAETWRAGRTHQRERGLVALYALYWRLWDRFTPGRPSIDEAVPTELWAAIRRPVLRMAILLGPSAHLTALCIATAAGRPELYMWGVVTVGNLWGILVLAAAGIADRRLAALALASPAAEAKGA
jgi:phosphatidylglycerophosphate synthase